jgi:FMN phosphatase YigB (HAD superfamily)
MARPWLALDVGGVLFHDGAGAFVDSFPEPERAAAERVIRSPAAMALRRGQIEEDAFWNAATEDLPSGWTAETFREAWYDAYAPNDEIFQWVKELQGKISLAIFSGNIISRVEHLEARRPFRHYFDKEIWSYDHGATKPEPAFVWSLLDVLDTLASTIFYVDDKSSALRVAEDLGINGFLYRPGDVATLRTRFMEFHSHLSES